MASPSSEVVRRNDVPAKIGKYVIINKIGIGIFLDVVDLDRNVAAVVWIVRKKDIARTTLADLIDNDVLTDFRGHVIPAYDF